VEAEFINGIKAGLRIGGKPKKEQNENQYGTHIEVVGVAPCRADKLVFVSDAEFSARNPED
jgi:hypothetical protein